MIKTFTVQVQDNEDEDTFTSHLNGPYWKDICVELSDWLRSKYKYENIETISTSEVRQKLFDLVSEHDLTLI